MSVPSTDSIRKHEDEISGLGEFDRLLTHYGDRIKEQKAKKKEDYLEPIAVTKKEEWNDVQAAIAKVDASLSQKAETLWRLPKVHPPPPNLRPLLLTT